MRYLTKAETLELHRLIIQQSGGSLGLRDLAALNSALAQPRQTFGGADLYATVAEKAAAVCFSLVSNHPFIDCNKQIGHVVMKTFLVLNGYEISAPIDDQETIILRLADDRLSREELIGWLRAHLVVREAT